VLDLSYKEIKMVAEEGGRERTMRDVQRQWLHRSHKALQEKRILSLM
jgi:hypothetical protein